MRCDEVEEILEGWQEQDLPETVRGHLAGCSRCSALAPNIRLVRAGFHALAEAAVPEASLGFAARLARRLEDVAERGRSGADSLEWVGRRFVYATLVLTLTILLALVLPSSGPLRGPATADLYAAQTEVAAAGSDLLLPSDEQEDHQVNPVRPGGQYNQGQP